MLREKIPPIILVYLIYNNNNATELFSAPPSSIYPTVDQQIVLTFYFTRLSVCYFLLNGNNRVFKKEGLDSLNKPQNETSLLQALFVRADYGNDARRTDWESNLILLSGSAGTRFKRNRETLEGSFFN